MRLVNPAFYGFLCYFCLMIQMNDMKGFFKMTRRERRGTIVLLVLLALVMAGTLANRSCRDAVPEDVKTAEMLMFESEIDSSKVTVPKSQKKKRSPNKKSKKRRTPPSSSPKPNKPPRPIDPVPRF